MPDFSYLWRTDPFRNETAKRDFAEQLEREESYQLQLLAKKRYTNALPQAVATFYLPPRHLPDGEDEIWVHVDSNSAQRKISDAVKAIPFPCIRIVRELHMPPDDDKWKRITTDVVVWSDGEFFTWAAKDTGWHHDNTPPIDMYSPHNRWGAKERQVPQSYLDLISILADSSNRYEEQHVNRQTRRREGFSRDYREYIVIRNGKRTRNPNYLRRAEVFRRHPKLHAVRGHLRQAHERHLRSGQIVHIEAQRISAYARGGGPDHKGLLRVKDYITQEEHVRNG